MKFQPVGSRVLVKISEEKEENKVGSLYVPESAIQREARSKPQKATVSALGKKDDDTEFQVTVGDTVLLLPNTGVELESEEGIYRLVSESEILGIFNDK